MQSSDDEDRTPGEMQEGEVERLGIRNRLRQAVGAAGERAMGAADTVTGVRFRRQFEDFTDAVTTAVVGVHRDQADLRDRVERLETAKQPGGMPPLVIAFGIIAALALVLAIIALARTF